MEKFTQNEYEQLKNLLNDIHIHPESLGYEVHNNDVLEKLYNWFNNNSYGFVDLVIESDKIFDSIFYKILVDVEAVHEKNVSKDNFYLKLNRLKNYYEKIENKAKEIMNGDTVTKKYLINIINDILLNDSEKLEINVNELKEKLKSYNIQADIISKDLTSYNNETIKRIDEDRSNFSKILEIYKNNIEETKEKLIKQYEDLNEYHNNFQEKIYKDINDIQNSVNREQLAAYFLNERRKLKGDIDLSLFICIVLAETSIYFFLDIFTEFWHTFTFLKMVMFLVCIFIIILLFAKLGDLVYCNIFNINEKRNIEPFDEMKALLTPYWCWLGLTFAGMGCIAKVAYSLYYINSTKVDHLDPYLLFANLPVFMVLVWFTWFCSKQFSYTKQICDEYEYKYALSKSYLSYRDEARNISLNDEDKGKYEAVIVSLLDSVIKNIATSPVKSVKPDCHTPFTEVFNSIRGTVDVVKDGKDVINK